MTGPAAAQQPAKIKRPVKNPPQFPNIIDLENKDSRQTDRQTDQQDTAAIADGGGQTDSLAVAVQSLANELRTLGQELRSLNIRGQAQFEMLRMTRVDMRIDSYERELRPVRERIACGSALKFCQLAEGRVDIYPRLATTCEWDVAAGHALLTAAGGSVLAPDGSPLRYGQQEEHFRIPAFVAWGDPASPARLKAQLGSAPEA